MTRARKWVSCACGHNWTWQRQVESGEDTHCAVCGRNWQKQLSKQQASKEGSSEQPKHDGSPTAARAKAKEKAKDRKASLDPLEVRLGQC